MRNVAPSSTAFTFTSRSSGNCKPKSSASVRASCSSPPHCLLMRPTLRDSSRVFTCQEGKREEDKTQLEQMQLLLPVSNLTPTVTLYELLALLSVNPPNSLGFPCDFWGN